eukprot:5183117-Pyramimonas_sp.AAC.1
MPPQPPLPPPAIPPMQVPAPMQASSSEYLGQPEQHPKMLKAQADRAKGLPVQAESWIENNIQYHILHDGSGAWLDLKDPGRHSPTASSTPDGMVYGGMPTP